MKRLISIAIFSALILLFHGSNGSAKVKSILVVGDSHTAGFFGRTLDENLRTLSDKVTTIGSCGSSPSNWARSGSKFQKTNCGFWKKNSDGRVTSEKKHTTPSFSQALDEAQPDITIIALGTNMLSSPRNIKKELKSVEALLQKTRENGSRCIWIGPPDVAKNPFRANLLSGIQQMKDLIEKSNCYFLDSNQFTRYPSKAKGADGIHYPKDQAIDWAKKLQPTLESLINKTDVQPSNKKKQTSKGAGGQPEESVPRANDQPPKDNGGDSQR